MGEALQDFVRRLQEEYLVASELKARQQEDVEKRERERQRLLAEELRIDSRARAEREVRQWLQQAMQQPVVDAVEVTRRWALLARCGRSKTQLRDYVSVLESLLQAARTRSQEGQVRCTMESYAIFRYS